MSPQNPTQHRIPARTSHASNTLLAHATTDLLLSRLAHLGLLPPADTARAGLSHLGLLPATAAPTCSRDHDHVHTVAGHQTCACLNVLDPDRDRTDAPPAGPCTDIMAGLFADRTDPNERLEAMEMHWPDLRRLTLTGAPQQRVAATLPETPLPPPLTCITAARTHGLNVTWPLWEHLSPLRDLITDEAFRPRPTLPRGLHHSRYGVLLLDIADRWREMVTRLSSDHLSAAAWRPHPTAAETPLTVIVGIAALLADLNKAVSALDIVRVAAHLSVYVTGAHRDDAARVAHALGPILWPDSHATQPVAAALTDAANTRIGMLLTDPHWAHRDSTRTLMERMVRLWAQGGGNGNCITCYRSAVHHQDWAALIMATMDEDCVSVGVAANLLRGTSCDCAGDCCGCPQATRPLPEWESEGWPTDTPLDCHSNEDCTCEAGCHPGCDCTCECTCGGRVYQAGLLRHPSESMPPRCCADCTATDLHGDNRDDADGDGCVCLHCAL